MPHSLGPGLIASITNRPMSQGRKHGSTLHALDVSETYCCCTVGSIHVIDLDLFSCHKAHPNSEPRIPSKFKRATLAYATLCIHVESLRLHASIKKRYDPKIGALSRVAGSLVVRPAAGWEFFEKLLSQSQHSAMHCLPSLGGCIGCTSI